MKELDPNIFFLLWFGLLAFVKSGTDVEIYKSGGSDPWIYEKGFLVIVYPFLPKLSTKFYPRIPSTESNTVKGKELLAFFAIPSYYSTCIFFSNKKKFRSICLLYSKYRRWKSKRILRPSTPADIKTVGTLIKQSLIRFEQRGDSRVQPDYYHWLLANDQNWWERRLQCIVSLGYWLELRR